MKKLIPILMCASLLTSCATLMRKNTKQEVTFTTDPPSAIVLVDGKNVGTSPVTVSLDTKEDHSIQYQLSGYPSTNYVLEGRVLPKYVAADLALGGGALGWIPLLIDRKSNKWKGFDQWEVNSKGKFGAKLPVTDKDGDGIADDKDDCPTVRGLAAFNGCPDSDGDGIKDSDDVCPSTKGLAKFKGCPDTDGDGVVDSEDKCPTVAGPINGCPKKEDDKDGDGIADAQDACPTVKGLVKFNGCPDTDGDGIADNKDNCPSVAGVAANNGCPQVNEEDKKVLAQAMEGLFFKTGSAVIERKSYAVLDNVAKVMLAHPEYKLQISGYTDNTGKASSNLRLSKARAAAAKAYLIKDGVAGSRMTSEGYGIENPRATNSTAAGRALNRRVEFKVVF
ncbi:MAG: OmpA family protein [Flavobacteriales bacterium]